jgi:hypothetical protein
MSGYLPSSRTALINCVRNGMDQKSRTPVKWNGMPRTPERLAGPFSLN